MVRRPLRLLVATRHNPFPENDGAGAYIFDLLRFLAQNGFEIEVAWLQAEGLITRRGHWRVPDHFANVARLHIIGGRTISNRVIFPKTKWLPFKARRLHEAKTALRFLRLDGFLPQKSTHSSPARANSASGSSSWSALPSSEEAAFFQERLRAFEPDIVLVNYAWLTPLLSFVPAGLPTVVLTNDVVSQRLSPTPGLSPDPATPEGEAALLSRARHVLAISADDAAFFRKHLGTHSILLVPKAATPAPLGPPTAPLRILFVGGINSFNQEGLRWFLKSIWPLVKEATPAAEFHICGGICTTVEHAPQGVVVRGRVDDLVAEYAAAAVVVVPLLNGSGIKIKLVEAASHGKAIVTTPVGLQGLSFLRDSVMETTEPAEFASAITRLLAEPALQNRLGTATLAAVKRHLSPQIAYGPVCQVLQSASQNKKR